MISHSTVLPEWFLITDGLANVIYVLLTLFIALFSYRTYKFFGKPRFLLMSVSFSILSLGYLLFAIIDFFKYPSTLSLSEYYILFLSDVRSLVILTGLILLLFLYYEITDRMLQILMFLLVFFGFVFAHWDHDIFFVLSSLLIFFIMVKLLSFYRVQKKRKTLFMLIGFAAWFASKMLLAVALIDWLFVLSLLCKLLGFASMLVGLVWVYEKD